MIKTPFVATDSIIKVYDGKRFLGIVLIERKNFPTGIALPGGFVELKERVEDACKREMKEETGLDIEIEKLLGVYSDPNRDPRFHTVSVCFVSRASGVPRGGDDAKRAFICKVEDIPWSELLFDHSVILEDFLRCL